MKVHWQKIPSKMEHYWGEKCKQTTTLRPSALSQLSSKEKDIPKKPSNTPIKCLSETLRTQNKNWPVAAANENPVSLPIIKNKNLKIWNVASKITNGTNREKIREDWKLVENRCKKTCRNKPIIGENSTSNTLQVAQRFHWLFISGLDRNTECQAIVDFLLSKNLGGNYVCEKMQRRNRLALSSLESQR